MRAALLLIFMIFLSGCATKAMHKEANDPRSAPRYPGYYAGTKTDLEVILFPFLCNNEGCMAAMAWPFILPFAAIDTPFSFLLDTYYLPRQYSQAKKLGISNKEMWKQDDVLIPSSKADAAEEPIKKGDEPPTL